jgi:hypothetical protein
MVGPFNIEINLWVYYYYYYYYTGSGVHPTSYKMDTGGSFQGVKQQGREAGHSPPTSAQVKKNVDLDIHSPLRLLGVMLN